MEAVTIILKIVGVIAAIFCFRWVLKIYKGKDKELDQDEFKKFTALVFFLVCGGWMIYKEGEREHEWQIYSEWYIFLIFGCLLTVLHMENALDKILQMFQAAKGILTTKTEKTTTQSSSAGPPPSTTVAETDKTTQSVETPPQPPTAPTP